MVRNSIESRYGKYTDASLAKPLSACWLQYNSIAEIATPTSSTTTYLIHPSNLSEALAAKQKLLPFCPWLNLTHSETYLHGPFEFTSVNEWKMRDWISKSEWDSLACQASHFQNPLPKFDLPLWSIYADCGVHVMICNPMNVSALCAVAEFDADCITP
jgi:hypothetical protein